MMFIALLLFVVAAILFAIEFVKSWSPTPSLTAAGLCLVSLGLSWWIYELIHLKMLPSGL